MAFFRSKRDSDAHIRYEHIEEKRIFGMLNFVVLLAIAAVAYTDWVVIANISLGYLYVLPLALSALVNPLWLTISLAAVCTFLQDIFGPPSDTASLRISHNSVMLGVFVVTGYLVWLIARQRSRLVDEVRQQRDEYESDLGLAAQVQQQVLPGPRTFSGLELAGTMHAARLLGGDYYDFFQISDDIVDVVIADVSGKGAAAALLMPSLSVALRLRAHELSGPAAIMKDLDGVLRQVTRPASFVTMFYARFHLATRTLEYANGGHNPPILLRPGGETRLLEASGPILGILDNAVYSNVTINLEAGDILALYTDGVTEQENNQSDQFSVDRLEKVLDEHAHDTAVSAVDAICEAVPAFAGMVEQSDDFTVVVAKVS
jgi:serine phosphatase RsbU (regulator of sigma subunit)